MEQTTQEAFKMDSKLRDEFVGIIEKSGAVVIPPKKYDIPQNYDLEKYPEEARPFINESIRVLTDFLNAPIIKDNFTDHLSRRAWRKQTYDNLAAENPERAELFDRFLADNKMKRNNLAKAMGYALFLSEDNIVPDDVSQRLVDTVKSTTPTTGEDPWEGPTTPWKIQKVEEIADLTADVLNSIGK